MDVQLYQDQRGHTASASKADGEQKSYITVTSYTKNGAMILFVDKGSSYGVRSIAGKGDHD